MTHPFTQLDDLELARRARDEAASLLNHLLHDRRHSEARFAETGKLDPLKNLTGESALDRAVKTTEGILHDMEELLTDLRGDHASEVTVTRGNEVPTPVTNGTLTGRP